MASDFSYDPVTALDEASATGEAAAIFADIRATLGLPLVTSIWRGLAGMDDGLARVWALTRPIYASGLPQAALARVIDELELPRPVSPVSAQLACVGVTAGDLDDIGAIVSAYNRSNGLNLVALAALVAEPARPHAEPLPRSPSPQWPALRPLLAREAIAAETWSMVQQVNRFGAPGPEAAVATLWRHLAHWPGLLALLHAAFAPLQASGAIAEASVIAVALALREGAHMAHLRPVAFDLPQRVRETVIEYVRQPTQVARMVVMGHALARWLESR